MLPDSDDERRAILLRWTMGDEAAAAFLGEIAEIARLADDIVDEDENRQRNVQWLLHRTLIVLPRNPFFIAHSVVLAPLITTIIIQWGQSDEWRSSRDALKRTVGFVWRDNVISIVTAVAAIVGGHEHARKTAEDAFEVCLGGRAETVEQWVKE